jgi:hypothetical protein
MKQAGNSSGEEPLEQEDFNYNKYMTAENEWEPTEE